MEEAKTQQIRIAQSATGFNRTVWSGLNPIKPFHEEWLNLADSGNSFILLAPRDHFKTTILTLNYTLYRIVKDPDVQIILVSESATQAHKWTRYLMNSIEQRFPWLNGNTKDGKWSERMFTVPRTRESKDPTCEAVGMLGRILGGHYDLAMVDDVVSMENSRSQIMRDHVEAWFKQVLIPAMVPNSQILPTGSPWHYGDLYARLEADGWKTYKYRAVLPDGSALFPERYGIEALAKKRFEIGTPIFNCQYLCDPKGLIGRLLRLEWLEPYYDVPPGDLEIVQGVDVALSEKETADYTAIATVGYSPSLKTIFLLDMWRGHVDFPSQIQMILQQAQIWKPTRIIVEINAYQKALYQVLRETMLPIITRQTVKDKVMRILAMSPYFESKKLLVRRSQEDFISEYLQFPDAEHDDMLDALEFAVTDIVARRWAGSLEYHPVSVLGKVWKPKQ